MRLLCTTLFVLAFLGTGEAYGQYYSTHFTSEYKAAYGRNKCWPQPYMAADRAAVTAPFAAMVNNGWSRQNLVGAHHYSKDTAQLNEAGKLKVQWIVTQAPMDRRTIFVERGGSGDETAARVEDVRIIAGQYASSSDMPDVRESELRTQSWSGDYAERINSAFRASTPEPRLPAATNAFSDSN